jgi:hypothetical protein
VLSALSHRDEAPASDGFEGLGETGSDEKDELAIAEDVPSNEEQPPASELARRWRNLCAGTTEN